MSVKDKGNGIAWLRAHVGYEGPDCLIWPFSRREDGRGQFGFNGKYQKPHRWMCEATHGPAPTPKHQAAHECGKGHLGCVNPRHLKWKTPIENRADSRKHGTLNFGVGRPLRKLTQAQAQEIIALRGIESQDDLAERFGVTAQQVGRIQAGLSWKGGVPGRGGFKIGDPRARVANAKWRAANGRPSLTGRETAPT